MFVERDTTRCQTNMKSSKKHQLALCAGLLTIAASAFASAHTLTTPPPSEFVDAESSSAVPIPSDEGRHLNLTIAFDSTPSNAVLVAFGRDLNGSETLEPEETELIVGCDCGEPFVWEDEVKVKGEGEQRNMPTCSVVPPEQDLNHHCSPSPSTFTSLLAFHIRQAQSVAERWTLAKVMTHNLADTNLTVTADFYTKGTALILR